MVRKISQRKWEGLRCEEEAGIHRIGNYHKSESRKKGVNHKFFFIVPYLVKNMPAHVGGVEVRGKGRKAMRLRMQSCVVLSGTLRILNSCLMYTSLNKYTLYHGGVLWL